MQVGGGLVVEKLGLQFLVADADPADAHARGDDLGEGAQHAALLTQLLAEAVRGGTGKADLTVGIILEEKHIAVLEDLNDLVVDFLRIAQAGGVLEIRDQVGKLGIGMILDRLGKLIAVDAVGIHGNSQNLRIENMEGLERDQISGILDNDFIVGVDHHRTDHGEGLLGAVGDDNVVRAHVADTHGLITFGNPLTQCRPTLGGAVLQRRDAVLFQNLLCGSFHFRNGEGNGVRKTAGKGDNVESFSCIILSPCIIRFLLYIAVAARKRSDCYHSKNAEKNPLTDWKYSQRQMRSEYVIIHKNASSAVYSETNDEPGQSSSFPSSSQAKSSFFFSAVGSSSNGIRSG